jgi:hypothetical protein
MLMLLQFNLESYNIEFSCRPESADHAPVLRTAFLLKWLHPGGQLQRLVILSALSQKKPHDSNDVRQGLYHTLQLAESIGQAAYLQIVFNSTIASG